MSVVLRQLLSRLLVWGWMGTLVASTRSAPLSDSPSFVVKSWRTADGLPQNSVQAIAQTGDGYLWVGTQGGLARFDGVRFTSYGLSSGLQSLHVTHLIAEGHDGLWIATFGGGLSHYRGGVITTLTTSDGLAHNNVLVLASAGAGAVWVGSAGGLQLCGTNGFTRIGDAQGLPAGEVVALASDREAGVWVALDRAGLFHCRTGHCELIEGPQKLKQLVCQTLLVDDGGALWAGIGNGRILRRDGNYWTEFNSSNGVPGSYAYCLAQGDDEVLWAGSHAQGLWVFQSGRFHLAATTPDPLDLNIRALCRTREGLLWVGTQTGGLSRIAPQGVKVSKVGHVNRPWAVNGLVEDLAGQFYVTTYGGGLHRGNLDSLEQVRGKKSLDDSPFLLTTLRTRSGALYFGGVKRLHWFPPGETNLLAISFEDTITALCEGTDGSVWLGTRAGSLQRLENRVPVTVTNGTFAASISGLICEPGGAWWIATRGAGLFRWEAGERQHWTTAEGLPALVLRGLHRDADGTLWVGTAGGGLAWLTGGRVHSVDSRQGLGEDNISQILEDDAANLWLGGNHGIFRVSKRELYEVAAGRAAMVHPLGLDQSDGMLESECTGGYSPAGLRSESGLFCFSTVGGVVAFDPNRFGAIGLPPPVLVEEAFLDGKHLSVKDALLSLAPGPRELEIRYTAFNYAKPGQIRFRHRLNGLNAAWTDVGSQRSARFALLPPGRYAFEVNASNQDGHWSETAAELSFVVQPFYYQTNWFFASVAMLLMTTAGLSVWQVARVRIRRAQQRERLAWAEAEAQQHRNQVAHLTRVATLGELSSTLAHELNQPLTAILSNAQAAQRFFAQDKPDPAVIRDILQDIVSDDQRASEVIRRMRTLLKKGEFKLQVLEVNEVIQDVLRLMEADLKSHSVSIDTKLALDLPPIRGDRVQLQQVLINLVNNARDAMLPKVSSARTLTLRSSQGENGVIQISVADSGCGIPPGDEEKIFEPYHTTKAAGLGLGLSLSRSILLALGGRLWAENRAEGGAAFHLTLPVGEAGTSQQ